MVQDYLRLEAPPLITDTQTNAKVMVMFCPRVEGKLFNGLADTQTNACKPNLLSFSVNVNISFACLDIISSRYLSLNKKYYMYYYAIGVIVLSYTGTIFLSLFILLFYGPLSMCTEYDRLQTY